MLDARFSRRKFIATGTAAAAFSALRSSFAAGKKFSEPLYFQAAAVREDCIKDVAGTLDALKKAGYAGAEWVYMPGLKGAGARGDFGPLADTPPVEFRKMLNDHGMACESAHFWAKNLADDTFSAAMDWAHGMQLNYIVLTSLPAPKTEDDWKANYELMNRLGERIYKDGLRMAYHTDADALMAVNGKIPFDEMTRMMPAETLQHEFDCSAFISAGVDPVEYLKRYPGRFYALHLRDGVKPDTPGKYVNAIPFGTGVLDVKQVLAESRKAKVQRYIVEMQVRPLSGALEAYKSGYSYLRTIEI
jgi:sugar phosphate isomerase/epimerase